jgi:hypothetical protein
VTLVSSKTRKGCREIIDEDPKNALSDYIYAEALDGDMYRCRDCGMIFKTLEEHDRHHRLVHGAKPSMTLSDMRQ